MIYSSSYFVHWRFLRQRFETRHDVHKITVTIDVNLHTVRLRFILADFNTVTNNDFSDTKLAFTVPWSHVVPTFLNIRGGGGGHTLGTYQGEPLKEDLRKVAHKSCLFLSIALPSCLNYMQRCHSIHTPALTTSLSTPPHSALTTVLPLCLLPALTTALG